MATSQTKTERKARCTSRLCDRVRKTSYLASLPKLQGKASLVTGKLCEEIYKSTTGHVFDLSTYSKEPRSLAQLQYNSLHDPHLKSYLYRPDIQSTLLERGHVSVNLRVACSLREHNDYQYFLEREFLKLHNWEEEEKNSNYERCHGGPAKENKLVETFKQERAENRKQFLKQQERKLQVVRSQIKKLKREEDKVTEKVKEQQWLVKEKEEMKRIIIKEQKKFIKQQKEEEEASRRRLYYRKVELKDCERVVNLHNKKQEKYAKRWQQLEEKRMRYEMHAQLAQEEEERKRKQQLEEKERKSRRREKIFKELQQRDIVRKIKLFEENQQQALLLKQEADKFEAHWLKARESEIMKCRQKLQKWQKKEQQQQDLSIKVSCNASKRQTAVTRSVTATSYQGKSLSESKSVRLDIQQ